MRLMSKCCSIPHKWPFFLEQLTTEQIYALQIKFCSPKVAWVSSFPACRNLVKVRLTFFFAFRHFAFLSCTLSLCVWLLSWVKDLISCLKANIPWCNVFSCLAQLQLYHLFFYFWTSCGVKYWKIFKESHYPAGNKKLQCMWNGKEESSQQWVIVGKISLWG